MAERGIECGRYLARIHLQPVFRNRQHCCCDLTVTEFVADRVLASPFFNTITEDEINEVVETLKTLVKSL